MERLPDTAQVEAEVTDVVARVNNSLTVTNDKEYLLLGEATKAIRSVRNKIAETFEPVKAAAWKAHKAVVKAMKDQSAPLDEAEQKAADILADYNAKAENGAPSVDGISFRSTWSAEVTDFMALVKAVAKGKAHIDMLKPDMTKLNAAARSLKSVMDLPGVEAVEKNGIAIKEAK